MLQQEILEPRVEEKRSREDEERVRSILENIEDGYYEVDLAGNFTLFNDSLCRMFGYPPDELLGMNTQQYTDEVNATKMHEAFNTVCRTGESVKAFDWEIIQKDGTKRFVEGSVSLMRNSASEPIGVRGIARDITERKRMQREIEERQEYLAAVLRNSPDAIVTLDAANRILEWNPAAERLFGYTCDEAVGKDIDDVVTRSDVKEQAIIFSKQVLSRKNIPPTEVVRYRQDGTPINVIVAGSPIIIEQQMRGAMFVYTDITERERMQREIEERQEYLAAVLRNAPDAIVTLDAANRILEWNPAAERLFGYTCDDVIGKDIDDVVSHHDGREQAILFSKQVLSRKNISPTEVVRYRKDGTPLNVIAAGSPIIIEQEMRGAVIVYADITERKRLEEQLKDTVEKLKASHEELSTPVVQIWDRVLALPLIGVVDSLRAQKIMETLLNTIIQTQSEIVILDITGVSSIDTQVVNHLIKTVQAANLLGVECVISGIKPEIAQTMIQLGLDMQSFPTRRSLRDGLMYALGKIESRSQRIEGGCMSGRQGIRDRG